MVTIIFSRQMLWKTKKNIEAETKNWSDKINNELLAVALDEVIYVNKLKWCHHYNEMTAYHRWVISRKSNPCPPPPLNLLDLMAPSGLISTLAMIGVTVQTLPNQVKNQQLWRVTAGQNVPGTSHNKLFTWWKLIEGRTVLLHTDFAKISHSQFHWKLGPTSCWLADRSHGFYLSMDAIRSVFIQ